MQQVRVFHACLALFVILAFTTGEAGRVHAWLGYAVAALILVRLALAVSGQPQLGLSRYYPQFQNLKLGRALTHPAISRTLLLAIAACAVVTVVSGVAMDQGRSLGLAPSDSASAKGPGQYSNRPPHPLRDALVERASDGGSEQETALGEAHELLANTLIALVVTHVSYLLLFKRPLARFMLFFPARVEREPRRTLS